MEPDNMKTAICDALAAFIRSRPGFDPCNYGDAASYRADQRTAARQKNDAETMLAAVHWRDSITGADLIEAARRGADVSQSKSIRPARLAGSCGRLSASTTAPASITPPNTAPECVACSPARCGTTPGTTCRRPTRIAWNGPAASLPFCNCTP